MRTDDLTLRPAEESDGPDLAAIHLAARRAAQMPPGIHADEAVRTWLGGRIGSDEVWVAEVAGRPAGYARLTPAWLDDLYVAPSHAGQGVGSALLELAMARRPGGFCLWVFEMNHPAQAFYRRRGLVELERTDGSGNEERAPDLRMAWPGEDPVAFFRGLIDEVDAELGALLNRRAAITRAIQPYKSERGRDAGRERGIAAAMAEQAPTLGTERLARIVDAIITESLDAADG